MSAAQRIASALNQWEQDGRDMMGGADGDALDRLLGDYFDVGEEGSCGRLDYCTCYHALIMHHSCIIVVFLCHDTIIISYLSAKFCRQ